MSFNVSRFIVRMRRFWTRERLVPVLGVTAVFLFLLNFYAYLNSLFEKRPIIALHTIEDIRQFRSENGNESHVFIFRHENDRALHRHRMELDRHRVELERQRRRLERERRKLEIQHDRLHRRIRIHRNENSHEIEVHEDGKTQQYVIEGADESGEEVRIEVNGQRVKIDEVEVEI